MFRAILETQWKWTRAVVLLATVIGFALPIASLQASRNARVADEFVYRMEQWAPSYALLAAGLGLLVALSAWASDHRGRHVYALSLPITRSRYALMRFGAGGIFLLAPVVALLIAALLVANLGVIPSGLQAYPVALTVRFALAALVAYSIFFAIASSTQKTAGILLAIVAAVLLAQYVIGLANVRFDLLARVADLVFTSPGVLSVFSGRWMLVDV